MRIVILVLCLSLNLSCNTTNLNGEQTSQIDIDADLKSIENTREEFMLAVKKKDYEAIGQLVTKDLKTMGPGNESWNDMYANSTNKGPFPYDSITMIPMETIIVSDSIAYDF